MFELQARGFDAELEREWKALEHHSSLFGSWDWNKLWWQTWGDNKYDQFDLELALYSVHTSNGETIAILPFYQMTRKRPWGTSYRQWQVIGNLYPTGISILSEYCDILFKPEHETQLKSELPRLLHELGWKNIVIPFTSNEAFLSSVFEETHSHVHQVEHGLGAIIDTKQSFEHYTAGLGKNTRLKLLNRRKNLNSLGAVSIEYANPETIEECFAQLNAFHQKRWGSPCFGPDSLKFHHALARCASEREKLRLSRVLVDNKCVSVLYNILHGTREYNIQSGYLEDFHPKISVGTLHLGYAVEKACWDAHIEQLDLLFGQGKNSDYKQKLVGESGISTRFYTLNIFGSKSELRKAQLEQLTYRSQRKIRHIFGKETKAVYDE